MTPQCAAVLALLRERGTRGVTPLDALEHVHTTRLAARVWDLRDDGFDVRTEWVTADGVRFARYVLIEAPEQARLWENDGVEYSDTITHNDQRPVARLYSERRGVGSLGVQTR